MKMGKSSIKKRYNKVPPELVQTIDFAADYIKSWTNREIGRIRTSNQTPVIIPTNNGYRVGNYRLHVLQNKTCEVYNAHGDLMHSFDSKVSAVLFTIYTTKCHYRGADEILLWDKEINKHYTDVLSLRRGVERAVKLKDYESADIRQSRLEIARNKLDFARVKISKIHMQAKYNKVWE